MSEDLLNQIMRMLGSLDERTKNIDRAVGGNGQPGLKQRVEALEAHRDKTIGAITVVGTIGAGVWVLLEFLFHYFKAGK